MNKLHFLIGMLLLNSCLLFSQVAINTDGSLPDNSAMLDVKSSSMGILLPRLSNADRNVIPSPGNGLLIYNISTNLLNYFNGSQWVQIAAAVTSAATGSAHPGGGVSINASPNSPPDSSAMLDVNNPSRGILIPRTIPDSVAIPARGLLLYNVVTNLINFFNGNDWKELCASSTGVLGGAGSQNPIGVAINSDGTPIHPSAILDVSANTKGVLIPRLTENQRNALFPINGLAIYNLNLDAIEFYNGTSWCKLLIVGSLPAPTSGTQVPLPTQITWNWNTVPGAAGYKWNTTNNYATATDMAAATTMTETGLACGTAYTRFVWAYSVCENSTALTLNQTTTDCPPFLACGISTITINHLTTGGVAPVNKTTTYGMINNIPGEPSKCWITSNLGSDHQATAADDSTEASAGWYWQFNRKQGFKHDGNTVTPEWTINNISEYSDWLPTNDPCNIELGTTWHIPTYTEWNNVDNAASWATWTGPWSSGLKLHAAGGLHIYGGTLSDRGSFGEYWSSQSTWQNPYNYGWFLYFSSGFSDVSNGGRKADGFSVRCVNEACSAIPTVGTHLPLPTQITWNWNSVPNAAGYKWNITDDYATATDMATATTMTETGLACGTVYYRYVWAYSVCGNSAALTLNQSTTACSNFICGTSTLTINHLTAYGVAPVNKTTTYGTVTNIPGEPTKCWITSNLGSDHQATAVDDSTEASAGWYWQFNRKQGYKHDGNTLTPAWTINSISEYSDWLPTNDPCNIELGTTWHIPTYTEWNNVDNAASWATWTGPWSSGLKLHAAGGLHIYGGTLSDRGSFGEYWSSQSTWQNPYNYGWFLYFSSGFSDVSNGGRKADAFSVRCIDETCSPAITIPASGTHTPSAALIIWNWNTVPGATGYKWNITNDYATAKDMATATTMTETGLACGMAYTRYVWAYGVCGNSSALTLNQTTTDCPPFFTCGISGLTINHLTTDGVAPVNKTTTYGTVTNIPGEPAKCWITSNLGSDHHAIAVDDATEASAGWYWQFNRKQGYKHDGTTLTPGWTITSIDETSDWLNTNDPCTIELGAGWRIPTFTEWDNVDVAGNWINWNRPFSSGLQMHAAGNLYDLSGSLGDRGSYGNYWCSTQRNSSRAWDLTFGTSYSEFTYHFKAFGFSVRCITELCPPTLTSPPSGTHLPSATQIIWNWNNVPDATGYKWNTTNSYADATDMGTAITKTETGLTCNTAYTRYVWAYNACGNSTPVSLNQTTSTCPGAPCPGRPTVTYEGQVYNTVQIGTQCWFKENLNIGTRINGALEQSNNGTIEKYCYNDLESNCNIYGGLYQWNEMMQYVTTEGVQGICPTGWHIPTFAEWTTVTNFLGGALVAGGKMKSTGTIETGTGLWSSPNTGATNESGFSAIPAGNRYLPIQLFINIDIGANLWSSNEAYTNEARTMGFEFYLSMIESGTLDKINGASVRCLADTCLAPTSPTSGTHAPSATQIIWNWNTTAGATGYKWGTTNVYASATDMGTATTKTETGLTCNTACTRYVWAYDACGNSIPVTLNQTTSPCPGAPCPGIPTVTYGGQVYHTVQIGTQCWFKENLNIGTRINGALEQSNNGTIEKYCYNDLESNCNIYGGLYQWSEMMQYVTPAGGQEICPTGWHIPTDAEWTIVTTSLGGEGVAGGKMKSTGTIEAGTGWWYSPNTGATNESGFSGVPAGYRGYAGGFFVNGYDAGWWSSSEFSTSVAWYRFLYYNGSNVDRSGADRHNGFSVRCLADTCPARTSPTSGIHTTSGTQIIWNWNTASGATGYKWGTTNVYASATDMGTATTKTETGLTCNTAYARYAWAYNGCGNSTPVTLTQSTSPPPATPTEGIHVPSPTQIIWNWNTVTGATGYKWSTVNAYSGATDMGTAITNTETGLTCNTAYARYAWAYNACGNSTPITLTQTTSACFTCGSSITINHVAGAVAPVTKTTTYSTVTNIPGEPAKCWITSNLGSDHQASAVSDTTEASGGWYWQFNRKQGFKNDGTIPTPNTPWITSIVDPSDWITVNDPCNIELGTTWHIPTYTEWYNVDNTGDWTTWTGPWNSGMKLHAAGGLTPGGGFLVDRGYWGYYWSSTQIYASTGWYLDLNNIASYINGNHKSLGYSVRCVKD